MGKPLEKVQMLYCDVLGRDVECHLTRIALLGMHSDAYRCSRFGSKESPCNPCSNYNIGIFVPMPDEVVKEDSSLDFEAWMKAINATIDIPAEKYDTRREI